MATSGSFNTTGFEGRFLKFSWTRSGYSVANNTSVIRWTLEGDGTGQSGWYNAAPFKVVIDGKTVYSSTTRIELHDGTVVASGSVTFTHNASGAKSFSASVQAAIYLSEYNVSGSGSWSLDNIPRKSTLTVGNGTLGTAQTLTINKAASGFTHTITYKCGTASGTIATKTTGTSVSFTPPLSLASQNTAGTSVSITYTLTTYSGSTAVGSNSYTKTCAIPASVAPSCRVQVLDGTNYQATYGNLVQGLSTLKVNVTGTSAHSSPITAYSVTADGKAYTASSFVTPALSASSSVTVSATVKDKRGRVSTPATATFPVLAYSAPTINDFLAVRCEADGTENDQGDYIKVKFSATVTALNDKNNATYKLRYRKTSSATPTEHTFTPLANKYSVTDHEHVFAASGNDSYFVELVVNDDMNTSRRSTTISTAFTLTNWGADGTSIAFGKVAEEANTFQNGLHLNQIGNRYALSSPGVAGTQGFVLMANIEIIDANADTPITFVLSRRQEPTTMTVHVALRNSDMSASSVGSIKYEGTNYDAYLSPTGDMSWGFYVLKGSNYDTITIQDWYTSRTMQSRVRVTFPGTLVDQVPTPYYKATPAALDSILDYVYPVGSVYISYSHYDPATMFGGTWVRIQNAFLWGVDSSGTIGLTGGSKTHTLTINEMPRHNHGAVYSGGTAEKGYNWLTPGAGDKLGYNFVDTGGGAAHNNMPPYVQVSIWRRTA
jgi:hypothetical protein